jgi:hypothetical protein
LAALYPFSAANLQAEWYDEHYGCFNMQPLGAIFHFSASIAQLFGD